MKPFEAPHIRIYKKDSVQDYEQFVKMIILFNIKIHKNDYNFFLENKI